MLNFTFYLMHMVENYVGYIYIFIYMSLELYMRNVCFDDQVNILYL